MEDEGFFNNHLFSSMEEYKKKELSSDAVELSGGFFYPEPRSTIVRT